MGRRLAENDGQAAALANILQQLGRLRSRYQHGQPASVGRDLAGKHAAQTGKGWRESRAARCGADGNAALQESGLDVINQGIGSDSHGVHNPYLRLPEL